MLALAALGLLAAPPALAKPRRPAPKITSVRCWPMVACTRDPHTVRAGGRLRFRGRNLQHGMQVRFQGTAIAGKRTALVAKLRMRRPDGFVATVPPTARSGRVRIVSTTGRRSNLVGPITVVSTPVKGTGTAFDGSGMWIWYVSKSGGSAAAIAARAQQYGVGTVFVKSSDGSSWWSQFSPALVQQLKSAGVHVCAWQFVYGDHPDTEAALGARAAQTGADCLVIDAEGQYEGKYAQAQTYINSLRGAIGPDYPLSLSSFPYVDYHPSLPYSVFLGPNGAQYNQPQMYWKTIGTSVDNIFTHTYTWNGVYGRRIFPLGQLYNSPSMSDIKRFRGLAAGYGASGVSWWSWQSAAASGWAGIAPPAPAPVTAPATGYPALRSGSKGDVVVWAQQHLTAAGQAVQATGVFDAATKQAVSSFQSANLLPVTGSVDNPTWAALLRYQPAPVSWTARRGARVANAAGSRNGPRSAHLRAKRNEIPPAGARR
jgi:Putative peptidoglycan binding domain